MQAERNTGMLKKTHLIATESARESELYLDWNGLLAKYCGRCWKDA